MHGISNMKMSKNNNTESPFPISQVYSSELQSVVSPCENDHLKVKTRNSLSETKVNSYSHECSKSNFDSVSLSRYANRKKKTGTLNSFNHGAAPSALQISASSILHNEEFNESVDLHAYESSNILSPELHHLHYNHFNTSGNANLKLERREGVGQCQSIQASRPDEQNMNVSGSVSSSFSTSVECTIPKDTQYGKFSASAQHSSDLFERTRKETSKPVFDVEDKSSSISNQCVKCHAVQFLKNLNDSVTGDNMNLQEALKKVPISMERDDTHYINQDLNACIGNLKSQSSSIFEHSKAFSENGGSDMHVNVISSVQKSVTLAESELKEFPEPDLETQNYIQSPVAKSLFEKTFDNKIMLHEQKRKGSSMTKDGARAETNPDGDKVSSSFLMNSSLNNKIQDQGNSFQELSSLSRISSVKSTCQPVESKSAVQGNSYVSQNVLQTKQFSSRGCSTSDLMALYQKHLTGYQGNSSRSEDGFINKTEKIKFVDKELQTMECYPCYQKVSNQANLPSSINSKTCMSVGCQVSEFDFQPPQRTTDSEIGSSYSFDMVKFKDFLNRTLAQRLPYGKQKSNKSGITFCLSSLCLCHNKKTLGEDLFMNKPSFVARSVKRQQEIKNRNKTLCAQNSSPVTFDIPVIVHEQRSKSEMKKTTKCLLHQKCFATKECKVHIQKKYVSPFEIFKQQQKALVKKNMLCKCNRMMAKLYSERLKEAALKGKLDHALNEQLLSP
ncbi:uncharacterized protein LOC118192596 [Stegodyphus dumicola]|uniref:uncharacterized protein LOC118192596 n=1 Tax=Stegodyphus dumicola TaxID=202533 RepID=UPI0015AC44F8|nr:uncharacterized protein LOC118192596 [Stegodyphus dumicola]